MPPVQSVVLQTTDDINHHCINFAMARFQTAAFYSMHSRQAVQYACHSRNSLFAICACMTTLLLVSSRLCRQATANVAECNSTILKVQRQRTRIWGTRRTPVAATMILSATACTLAYICRLTSCPQQAKKLLAHRLALVCRAQLHGEVLHLLMPALFTPLLNLRVKRNDALVTAAPFESSQKCSCLRSMQPHPHNAESFVVRTVARLKFGAVSHSS